MLAVRLWINNHSSTDRKQLAISILRIVCLEMVYGCSEEFIKREKSNNRLILL